LEGVEIVNAVSGKIAMKVIEILAEYIHTDWMKQLKAVIQKGVFGYSMDDLTNWAFTIGQLLYTCAESAKQYKHPHCWLYIPTVIRHLYRGGPGMEIPNFAAAFGWDDPEDVAVGLCPFGKNSKCYDVYGF
jgi:hypothetical protein